MKKQYAPLNVLQTVVSIAKLILYFLMPMVAFSVPIVGELFGLKGLDVNNWGNFLGLVPLFLYVLMLLFSFGPLQRFSIALAGATLIVEIIIIANASSLIPLDTIKLLAMQYFPDYAASVDVGMTAASRLLLKPSLAQIISMILTLVYGVFQFIPLSEYLFGMNTSTMGSRPTTGGIKNESRTPRL